MRKRRNPVAAKSPRAPPIRSCKVLARYTKDRPRNPIGSVFGRVSDGMGTIEAMALKIGCWLGDQVKVTNKRRPIGGVPRGCKMICFVRRLCLQGMNNCSNIYTRGKWHILYDCIKAVPKEFFVIKGAFEDLALADRLNLQIDLVCSFRFLCSWTWFSCYSSQPSCRPSWTTFCPCSCPLRSYPLRSCPLSILNRTVDKRRSSSNYSVFQSRRFQRWQRQQACCQNRNTRSCRISLLGKSPFASSFCFHPVRIFRAWS